MTIPQRFSYSAINAAGEVQRGTLDANSPAAALSMLTRMQYVPLSLKPSRQRGVTALLQIKIGRRSKIPARDLVGFTQSLASLLRAGVVLDRGLAIMKTTSERSAIRDLCTELERRVREGESLTDALKQQPNALPNYYVSMVQAGELGGSLPEALDRLSIFMARAAEIRERLVSSLIYPAMLAGMVLTTLVLVLTVVLPKFKSLFQESQAQLPLPTQLVIALGDGVRDYGVLLLAAAGLAVGALWKAWHHSLHGPRLSRWVLKSRWTFGIIGKTQTSRFLRSVGTLIRSGVPVPQAAGVSLGMLENRALRAAGDSIHTQLKEGQPLSALLAQTGLFPSTAVQLVRVGEESGDLGSLLNETADVLDRETQTTIDRLLSVLVPSVTIVMGAVVAGLIASVLVGILSLNDLAF